VGSLGDVMGAAWRQDDIVVEYWLPYEIALRETERLDT